MLRLIICSILNILFFHFPGINDPLKADNDFSTLPPLRDAMKRGINKVTLVGHVGEDPKINQINDDVKVARFPLATNEFYVDTKIHTSTWEDNEGKKRFTTEINCDNFLFLSPQNQPVED